MAIYHLSVKFISRSNGRSAPSAAAYRSGEKIYDERLDKSFNYPGKIKQVLFSEILTPTGAPEWMKDREKLWNGAEAAENRKDSQVAKEFELALPKELSMSENVALLKEFVNEQFIKERLVADVNIHDQDRGNENIHAHVMLTTRRVVGDGFDEKKARDLDKKEILFGWREEWANKVNHHLALNGHNIHVDHRSYKEQGIDLDPQNKRGPKTSRKRIVEKTKEHLEIAKQNGEKIYCDPKIALFALSMQQSTFTKQDIARFINRHTVDQEQFIRVFDRVYNSPELIVLGLDSKEQERYSIKEMIQLEREMLDTAKILSEQYTHDISNPKHDRISMAVSRAGQNIKDIFVEDQKKHFDFLTLSEEQKLAVEHITKGNDLSCVLGYSGSGKSYMLGAARELWEKEGYRVRGLSLTGVAARGLEDGSGIKSQTIARQFLSWNNGRDRLSKRDIVVVDEVGMVASRQFYHILHYVKETGAKLVMTGDFNQIPPIEAGAAARAVMEKIGYVELTEIRRQIEPWQQEATKQLARGEIEAAIDSYYQKGYVHIEHKYSSAQDQIIDNWARNLTEQPEKSQIMIAYTNEEIKQLNLQARDRASEIGILGSEEYEVTVSSGKLKIAEHEKILFLKNNYGLGVMNGMLGEVTAINQNNVSVIINKFKENQQEITFNTDEYNYFTYGYAATAHKLQGATFDNAHVLVSEYFNKNIAYMVFTRHREELNIYHSFTNNDELMKVLSRDGSKDTTLDYPYMAKEILSYGDIAPLGDLGYMAFHHRELVKELELIGDKGVSFFTGRQERGLLAGLIEHNDKQYVVLEQEKEFKMYNQKLFYDNDEEELAKNIGCFVKVTKNWDDNHQNFSTRVSNSGLSLLEPGELFSYKPNKENIFVLGRGVDELQKSIACLESEYHKPANFNAIKGDVYGIYRGPAQVGDMEYAVLETKSELKLFSSENFAGVDRDKWIAMGERQRAVAIRQEEVPREYIFNIENKVAFSERSKSSTIENALDGNIVINTAIYESKGLEVAAKGSQAGIEYYTAKEAREALAESAESVVEELLGRPNERLSSATQWRYGNKGSLAISIAGKKRGVWYDFESGESGDLIGLIQKRTGMNFPETLRYVAGRFGQAQYIRLPDNQKPISRNEQHIDNDITQSKTSKYAQKLAAESLPISGTIVEKYLKETCGINNIISTDIRYHPQVFTGKEEVQKYMPAMLSLCKDKNGDIQCVQATYLDPQTVNKAELIVSKRTYASLQGALVSLQKQEIEGTVSSINANNTNAKDREITFIAEGVETGLSIKDAVENSAVMVTLGKSNFANIDPESVGQKVIFCLDNDGVDTFTDNVIHKAAERLIGLGKAVFITVPGQIEKDRAFQKTDFNDIARIHGVEAVRDALNNYVSYEEWQNSIEKNTGDKEISFHAEDKITKEASSQEPQLFNYTNEDRSNSFADTRDIESRELRTEELVSKGTITISQPDPYEKAISIEKQYKELEQKHIGARREVIKMFNAGFTEEELREPREVRKATEEELNQYANKICNDIEIIRAISQHDVELFHDMNKRFDNMFIEAIKKDDLQKDYINTHPESFDQTISKEERVSKMYEQYKETKQEYIDSRKEVIKMFNAGCTEEELGEPREIRDDAKDALEKYTNEICRDKDFMDYLSKNDEKEFNELNKRFNELMREQMENLQKDLERNL